VNVSRNVLALVLAAAVLTGCGGVQAPGALPGGVTAPSRVHGASGPSGGDLLYALSYKGGRGSTLHAFTYPGGQQVGIQHINASGKLCSNTNGNIFLLRYEAIDEYAHGGKHPIATFADSYYDPVDCSVDPNTGNLAVANESHEAAPGNVAVYQNATTSPTSYTDPQLYYYLSCGYDDNGNLFVVGTTHSNTEVLAELPKGSNTFTNITVNKDFYISSFVQWDGQYLALESWDHRHIYRVSISGSTGTVVHEVPLRNTFGGISGAWIQGNVVALTGRHVGLWHYPKGGKPFQTFTPNSRALHYDGVTVSVAPSHSSIRE
jgi:hypothetical protein